MVYWFRVYQLGSPDDPVRPGDEITLPAALDILQTYIRKNVEPALDRLFSNVDLLPNERDALGSFCYNFGESKMRGYNLTKFINEGKPPEVIIDKWLEYCNGGGKPLLGLRRRRMAEAKLYFTGIYDEHDPLWKAEWNDPWTKFIDLTEPAVTPPVPKVVAAAPAPKPEPELEPAAKPAVMPAVYNPPNDFDPNAGLKSMVYSRRFWGWMLIILGRFSLVSDGGSQLLSGVGLVATNMSADPMLFDMWTGMCVMFVGEGVRWWGERKATKPLI